MFDTLAQLRSKNMLPVIWFIFSRRGCDAAVAALSQDEDNNGRRGKGGKYRPSGHQVNLLTDFESQEVMRTVESLREQYPEAVREAAIEPLTRGIAAHHAGLLPAWKSMLEELFFRGLLKVIFATETLAAGLNMPARTTVISNLSKRTGDGIVQLSGNSLLQMAGRAGRRGKDKVGYCVFVQTSFDGAKQAADLVLAGGDPIVSQFKATYGMALNLLSAVQFHIKNSIFLLELTAKKPLFHRIFSFFSSFQVFRS